MPAPGVSGSVGMTPDTGIPARPSGQPIEVRTPSAGGGTGEPGAGGVGTDAHPSGHGI
jgi:hypothetical protein